MSTTPEIVQQPCDMLHCYGERVATLRFRPPGHAPHEGSFLYGVCQRHRDQLVDEPGYTEVVWNRYALRFDPVMVQVDDDDQPPYRTSGWQPSS